MRLITTIIGILLLGILLLGCSRRNEITVSQDDLYVFVGQVSTPGYAPGLKVIGNHVFVADEEIGITVIDISTPTTPTIVSVKETNRFPYALDAFPALQALITAEGSGDVGIYNYANPDSLLNESTVYAQSAQDVYAHVQNDSMFIWVADRDRDFLGYILELYVDEYNNRLWTGYEISEISMMGRGMGVYYSEGFIYIAGGQWSLHILDARDVFNIRRIGGIDTNGYSYSVHVVDNLCFLADGEKGLQIVDITDKTNPVFLANIDTKDSVLDLVAQDNLVFMATSQSGLYIVDVTVPTAPEVIQRFDTANARNVEVVGDYVYINDKYDGLYILHKKH